MPSGLKSFVIQYRTPAGKNRRVVIGRFGLMTVEAARLEAHEKLLAVSKGLDPIDNEANHGKRLTVAESAIGIFWRLLQAAFLGGVDARSSRPHCIWIEAASKLTSSLCSGIVGSTR
jgi:enoyl-[acyl-carrier-protein] reductase (NADH)